MDEDKKYLIINDKTLKPLLIGLGFILFGFVMFQLGINIGNNRGRFACNWAKNYQNNFGGPKGGFNFMMDRPGGDFIDGHGVFGEIIKISDNQIIINGQDKIEKIINIAKDTKIISFNQEIKLDQLKINDRIMILGDSNDQGKIDAKLIRVFNQPTPTSFKP